MNCFVRFSFWLLHLQMHSLEQCFAWGREALPCCSSVSSFKSLTASEIKVIYAFIQSLKVIEAGLFTAL